MSNMNIYKNHSIPSAIIVFSVSLETILFGSLYYGLLERFVDGPSGELIKLLANLRVTQRKVEEF